MRPRIFEKANAVVRGRLLNTRAVSRTSRSRSDAEVTATSKTKKQLPAELRRLVPQRLVFLCRLEFVVWCVAFIYMAVTPFLPGVTTTHSVLLPQFILSALMAASSVAVWRVAANSSRTSEGLLSLGLVFCILTAAAVSMIENGLPYRDRPTPSGVSFACVWVVFYPLVVPARPRIAAVTAFLGALMPALTLLVMRPVGLSDRSFTDIGAMVLNAGVATLLASVSSRFIYRLASSIDEARELGSYRLLDKLGEGGMGVVWSAQHRYLARSAAIKLVKTDMDTASGESDVFAYGQFEREAQAIASLESPNTVALYDYGISDEGQLYFVMEHLSGLDLETLVVKYGPVSPARMVFIVRQVCASLEEAHHHGLIHRDIKPSNIMLCRYAEKFDHVKVLDFGLVQNEASSASELGAGPIMGTPAYIPPECLKPPFKIDARGDQYALASVAYWLVSGLLVFEGKNGSEVATKRLLHPAPSLTSRGVQVPPALEECILRGLAREAEDRYPSISEFGAALADATAQPWSSEMAFSWWSQQAALPMTEDDHFARTVTIR